MKRFEYRFATREERWSEIFTQPATETVVAERLTWLNGMGNEGWELIKLEFAPNGDPHALLKRQTDA